jgi:hypothetical protein
MRQRDRDEVWATLHATPEQALRLSVQNSPHAWAARDRDGTFALWGVAATSRTAPVGIPWLLGADRLVGKYRRQFLAQSIEYIKTMLVLHPILTNYVDARNTESVRWLRWCGFTFGPATPWGVDQLPFYKFELRSV